MRPRRSKARRALRAALGVLLGVAASAASSGAQGGITMEGAPNLLFPVGGRTVGIGGALAATEAGSESLWGNPAGIARMTQHEGALHYSKTLAANGMALALVYPMGKAGVLGFGAQLYDLGAQDATDIVSGEIVGQILPRYVVMAATYAATIGPRVRAGLSYKVAQMRIDCSGPCGNVNTSVSSTNGVDAGVQYQTTRADSLTVGLAVRDMGLRLQVNDNAQSDPLPTRVHLGASALVPAVAKALAGAELRWFVELVNRTSFNNPAFRVGAELGLQKQLYLRTGYTSGTGIATGPALGLGFVRGRLGLDFARAFGGLSADVGEPPTYLTLRVVW